MGRYYSAYVGNGLLFDEEFMEQLNDDESYAFFEELSRSLGMGYEFGCVDTWGTEGMVAVVGPGFTRVVDSAFGTHQRFNPPAELSPAERAALEQVADSHGISHDAIGSWGVLNVG